MNKIQIRRAYPADAKLVSALSEETFRATYDGSCSPEDMDHFIMNCFSEAGILTELLDENDYYFIAFVDEVPAGYVRLKEDYRDYPAMKKYTALELKRIYVMEKYHGKKVGSALMDRALQLAKQKNFEAVWLGVWENNPKASKFYSAWGFEDTGFTHTFHIGNTAQTDHWLIRFLK